MGNAVGAVNASKPGRFRCTALTAIIMTRKNECEDRIVWYWPPKQVSPRLKRRKVAQVNLDVTGAILYQEHGTGSRFRSYEVGYGKRPMA